MINIDNFLPYLRDAIYGAFEEHDWNDFGRQFNIEEEVINSIKENYRYNNGSYKSHIEDILKYIIKDDENIFYCIVEIASIKRKIEKNNIDIYNEIYNHDLYIPKFEPKKTEQTCKEVVFTALKEAEENIKNNNYATASGLIHTALQGYLESICSKYKISFKEKESITALYKKINYLIKNNDKTDEKIMISSIRIIDNSFANIIDNSFANIIDKMNPIRNNETTFHTNENLIEKPEAILLVNSAKTIFNYLESKIV